MASDDIYNLLSPLLDECMGYFKKDETKSSKAFVQSLKSIHNNALHVRPIAVELIAKVAHRYDASPDIKANGYRSLLALLESLLHMIVGNLQTICKERRNIFFRANQYSDKLRCFAQNLHQMRALFYYAQQLIGKSEEGALFLTEHESDDIMHDCEIMAKSCFYSHTQGFQYYTGIQPIIQAVSMFTASYNDITQHSSVWKSTKSLINSGKYVVSPSVRGKKMEKIYSEADAYFFKAFFSLPEMGIGVMLPNLVGEAVRVNRVFNLPPKIFELETLDGDKVTIKRTSCLGNARNVKARLISDILREGQNATGSPSLPDAGLDKSKVAFHSSKHHPFSKTLVFFCHGGGFISMSSKAYEIVLREWSKELNCPVFAVDYSLAPDAPFPEAFEECFYAYCWALKNPQYLGTTAENIIFVGDSAGGNLVLSVAMRAAAYGIQTPSYLLTIYPACVIRYSASPSRLLAVMDPLLPHCMLSACLCAYTGFKTEKVAYNTEEHTLQATSDNEEQTQDNNHLHSPTHSKVTASPSKHSVTDNSIISTFIKDVGEGLGRLATTSSSSETQATESWWDDELFTFESEYKPEPVRKSSSVSMLFKGISDKFTRLLSPSSQAPDTSNTFWEDEFDMVSIDEPDDELDEDALPSSSGTASNSTAPGTDNNANSKSSTERKASIGNLRNPAAEAHFKLKLPNGFAPLKSKYFGERTKVYHTPLAKNPYISPALAPDEMLHTLPYVDVVACELDPLFDDSITLSRRFHKIGKDHQLHIVRGLPHGFLSIQMCKETREASKMCLELLKNKVKEFGSSSVE